MKRLTAAEWVIAGDFSSMAGISMHGSTRNHEKGSFFDAQTFFRLRSTASKPDKNRSSLKRYGLIENTLSKKKGRPG
jgi:hypothetical protein